MNACVLGVCAGGKNLELMNNEGVVVKIWWFKDVQVPNRFLWCPSKYTNVHLKWFLAHFRCLVDCAISLTLSTITLIHITRQTVAVFIKVAVLSVSNSRCIKVIGGAGQIWCI